MNRCFGEPNSAGRKSPQAWVLHEDQDPNPFRAGVVADESAVSDDCGGVRVIRIQTVTSRHRR
jgi:hypothetical protein